MNVDVPRPEHPHPQLARPDWRADIGTIQTLLGHKTAAMARRYAGQALDRQGARLMVQYSPVADAWLSQRGLGWLREIAAA